MDKTRRIVPIEDDDGNRRSMTRALVKVGYDVDAFESAEPALDHLKRHPETQLVVTDLKLPGTDGLGVLRSARDIAPTIGVLMITGHGSVESAVEAMKLGADDYLTKPVDTTMLRKRVSDIIEKRRLSERVEELEQRLVERFGRLIGRSKAMEALFRRMELVAPTRSNVLIVGESGTGKELVANALHEHSTRKEARFMPINCAAIPAEILESELFGHERGSFTGATARKVGKFELADGGTLFLDEIGELPLDMQVKLLRVLEQREFMRVGGSETIRVDIRLIAATNADLETAVERGRFRADLYYRLKVVTLEIPPLRARREDIPLLVRHFLDQFATENGREGLGISKVAMRDLVEAPWEGNVRELRNVVESLVILAPGESIEREDLPDEVRGAADRAPHAAPASEAGSGPVEPPVGVTRTAEVGTGAADPDAAGGAEPPDREGGIPVGVTMEELERRAILQTLEETGGNRTRAAEILGIGLRTLQRKLKEYRAAAITPGGEGIDRPD